MLSLNRGPGRENFWVERISQLNVRPNLSALWLDANSMGSEGYTAEHGNLVANGQWSTEEVAPEFYMVIATRSENAYCASDKIIPSSACVNEVEASSTNCVKGMR